MESCVFFSMLVCGWKSLPTSFVLFWLLWLCLCHSMCIRWHFQSTKNEKDVGEAREKEVQEGNPRKSQHTEMASNLKTAWEEGKQFLVSAPGKVIIHGEHAVVHGKVRQCRKAWISFGIVTWAFSEMLFKFVSIFHWFYFSKVEFWRSTDWYVLWIYFVSSASNSCQCQSSLLLVFTLFTVVGFSQFECAWSGTFREMASSWATSSCRHLWSMYELMISHFWKILFNIEIAGCHSNFRSERIIRQDLKCSASCIDHSLQDNGINDFISKEIYKKCRSLSQTLLI